MGSDIQLQTPQSMIAIKASIACYVVLSECQSEQLNLKFNGGSEVGVWMS